MTERFPGKQDGMLVSETELHALREADAVSPLKIQIPHPEKIHKLVHHQVQNKDTALHSPGIFKPHEFTDGILVNESSSIFGIPARTTADEQKLPTYSLSTTIHLSPHHQESSHHGYYNIERVQNIRAQLANAGLATKLFQDRIFQNYLYIPFVTLEVHIQFGPESRSAEEALIRWQVAQEKHHRGQLSDETQKELARAQAGLTNDLIFISLWQEHLHDYPNFFDGRRFLFELDSYRAIVQQFLCALHQEARVIIPETTLRWDFLLPQTSHHQA